MRQLPLEIKAAIIDELPNDGYRARDPFCGIALVWPDMLFRIRERRFHHIKIYSGQRLRSSLSLVESVPPIARAVSSITVTQDRHWAHHDRHDSLYEDLASLRKLFAMLANVSIISVTFPGRNVEIVEAFHCLPLSSITDVDFVFPMDGLSWTAQDILRMLRLFPSMERLGLETSGLDEGADVQLRPQENGPFRCDTLQSLSLTNDREFFHRLVDCMEFPSISSLCFFSCEFTSTIRNTLDRVSHLWDSTLKELRLRDIYLFDHGMHTISRRSIAIEADIHEDANASIHIPMALETLELEVELQDGPLIDFCTRTLERHASTASSLKTVSFCPKNASAWPTPLSLDDPFVRRLDAVLGSEELGVQHLEWWWWLSQKESEWLQEIFVCTKARFMSDEGRRKYETTYDGPASNCVSKYR